MDSPRLTRLTASSLNSVVYDCFGIFFMLCLSQVTLILRHQWQTKFQEKLTQSINMLKEQLRAL
jgi:hypothetical protein